MEKTYVLVNKTIWRVLSEVDKNYNSKWIKGSFEYVSSIRDQQKNKGDLIIVDTEYFCQKCLENADYIDEQTEELISECYKDIHSGPQGDIIRYESEIIDRSVNGFPSIFRRMMRDNIKESLWERFEEYNDYLSNNKAFNLDAELLNAVRKNIILIQSAWNKYSKQNVESAEKDIDNYLLNFLDDKFFVSPLNESYALRQVAFYDEMKTKGFDYQEMMNHPITLFRGRRSQERLTERKDLLHRPYVKDGKIERMRFTMEGVPALYLGTSSYTCWLELEKPEDDQFYVSSYIPNERGSNLKIFNLTVIEELINGVYNGQVDVYKTRRKELQDKMLCLFPLVMATSFKYVEQSETKDEYIIPELVMRVLKKHGIDGVAYLSKHLDDDLQLPLGVNIVIPVYKESLENGYGKVSTYFTMSKPKRLCDITDKVKYSSGSYIHDIYYRDKDGYKPKMNKEDGENVFGDSEFIKLDDMLVNSEMKYYNEE